MPISITKEYLNRMFFDSIHTQVAEPIVYCRVFYARILQILRFYLYRHCFIIR
jgi:hypothetical protein